MRSSSLASVLASAALVCLAPAARAEPVDAAAIDAIVRRALEAWYVPGVAVAIVRDGEVIYLRGHGVRDVEHRDAVTPDTLFPIASCTKGFTTTALAMLVDEGKVRWDDPVRKHVPFFHLSDPLADGAVTLRDLVCHRTGLAGHDLLWYSSPWSQEEIIRRIGRLPLDRPFRTAFQYQSVPFMACGFAVRSASGLTWADFVRRRLFEPLGMKATVCTTTQAAGSKDRARPHQLDAPGRVQVMPEYEMKEPNASGSIYSNARDLSRWVQFQLAGGVVGKRRLVSAASLEETHTPQIALRLAPLDREVHAYTNQMSYGMAWVIQDYRGRRLVSHAGAIDGFRAHLTLVPDARLGIVLLNNLHHTQMNQALSNSLVDLLLGFPRKDWNVHVARMVRKKERRDARRDHAILAGRHHGRHPSRELSAYTGEYENPAYGTVQVVLREGNLVWKWNRFRAGLEHFHYDTFMLPIEVMSVPQVIFTLDAKGRVARMKVTGHLGVEFRRKGG